LVLDYFSYRDKSHFESDFINLGDNINSEFDSSNFLISVIGDLEDGYIDDLRISV